MKKFAIISGVLIVIFIAVPLVITIIAGEEINNAVKPAEGVVSPAQFKSVALGSSKQDVIKRFGQPTGGISIPDLPRQCIVYDRSDRPRSGPDKRVYQFCFWSNSLDIKSTEIAATGYDYHDGPVKNKRR